MIKAPNVLILWSMIASLALGETLTRVANSTLVLPGDPPTDVNYQVVNAFGTLTFNQPIAVTNAPGDSDHVYVIERGGQMQQVNLATNSVVEFLDLEDWVMGNAPTVSTSGEGGFLSAAFHPNYQENGKIYVFYTLFENGLRQRIAEVTKDANTSRVASHTSLISQFDEASNHNGGDLHFGPDGYLYISVGDEGGANDQFDNSNFIDKDFFSAILRIDVDQKPGNLAPNAHPDSNGSAYSIPADNPFIGVTSHQGLNVDPADVRTEIWVTGLRNPFRFSFDSATGECFVADVGQGRREEINIVRGGEDCGWSRYEGLQRFQSGPAGSQVPSGYDPHEPIHDYNRTIGRSITGGVVYRGSRLPEFQGSYLFADFVTGRLFELKKDDDDVWRRRTLLPLASVSGFGHDPQNGDLLICRLSDGTIGRLQRTIAQVSAPATLSATGAFSDLTTLTPNAGIYPYEVNLPFWSDHAQKKRWFSMPDLDSTMTFSEREAWDYPAGQVWIKHFDLERERGNPATSRPLETRFLVKTDSGAYGLSYRWRADGSDADLVPASGMTEDLDIAINGSSVTQTWVYPSQANCLTCHTPDTNFALSFHTRQLNRDGQISELACAGFLDVSPPASAGLPAHPALNDSTISREARVRAYLEVNCAMCHQGEDGSLAGNYDARSNTKTDEANIINGLLADSLGDLANRFVVPGDVMHSAVLQRLDGSAPRMPPLASNEIDQEAIDLITAWVTQDLPARQSYNEWSESIFGSLQPREADFDQDGASNLLEFLSETNPQLGNSRFDLDLTTNEISFIAPTNRTSLLEMSDDLINWQALDVPGNSLALPAAPEMRTFPVPQQPQIFLRVQMESP